MFAFQVVVMWFPLTASSWHKKRSGHWQYSRLCRSVFQARHNHQVNGDGLQPIDEQHQLLVQFANMHVWCKTLIALNQ